MKEMDFASMIRRAVKIGNLREKMFCYVLIKLGYSNQELQALEIRSKFAYKFKKKYGMKIGTIRDDYTCKSSPKSKVWICWLQGMDNAPDVVKLCYKSVSKWVFDKEIIVIDRDNFADYVQMPEYVIEKWKAGLISNAHFCDLLRIELLVKYGGIWMDATVYLSNPIPEYMDTSKLFMYQTPTYDITRSYDNWFIIADKNDAVLKATRDLMYQFWQKNNKVGEYFVFHIALKCILDKNGLEGSIIKIPGEIPLMLSTVLYTRYNEQYLNEVERITPIHKLSYKNYEDYDKTGTFYEHLRNGSCCC